ncbi:MAG: serine/threonine-protein kinase [bacterium]
MSAPAAPSPGQAVLDDFTRQVSTLPDATKLRPELQALRKESDEALLLEALLGIALRLKREQRLELAGGLLSRLSQAEIPVAARDRAKAELDSILGAGSFGRRAEFLFSRFFQDATDPKLLVPMMAGTLVGELVSTAALGRLAGTATTGTSWLGRGLGARFAAGGAGYLGEVTAFAALNRALAPLPNSSFSEDLARSALTLGALRVFGGFARGLGESLALPSSATGLRTALQQSGAFLGLVAAHKLEERLGLRPAVAGSTFLLDTFASLVSLGMGAHLGRKVLGARFASFQAELGFRTRGLETASPQPADVFSQGLAYAGAGLRAPRLRDPFTGPLYMSAMGPGGLGDGNGGKRSEGSAALELPSAVAAGPRKDVSAPRLSQQGQAPVPPPPPPPPPSAPDPYVGRLIDGRYQIEAKLGEGGMGYVYRATHKVIGKKVALKVLKAELGKDKEVTQRFLNEARAASLIGNPHIIEINDFGQFPDGSTYFVMEYLNGKPLSALTEGEQTVSAYRIVHIARQIAEGLSAAHRAGIVHRDLKPDNVYLIDHGNERDFVKILDFGIAKVPKHGDTKLTRAGDVFGTPAYMSPEQAAGVPVDHRGDIYSVGVMLYEMASGKLPFEAETFMALLTKHMYHPLPPLRSLPSTPKDLPVELEAVIQRCLAKDPSQRYQTMDDLIADLDRFRAGLIPDAVEVVKNQPEALNQPIDYFQFAPKPSRWPIIGGIAGAGGVAALIAALLLMRQSKTGAVASSDAAASGSVPPPAPSPSLAPDRVTEKREVRVSVDPVDAHIFQGDKDLGNNSAVFQVEKDGTIEIEVRRDGYVTKTIVLDGSHPEEKVKLEREPKRPKPKPSAGGPATAPKPKSSRPGDEVVVPWK